MIYYTCPKGQKGRQKNMKVKEFKDWKAIHFNGRTVLKSDTRFFSWEQIKRIEELEVLRWSKDERELWAENTD